MLTNDWTKKIQELKKRNEYLEGVITKAKELQALFDNCVDDDKAILYMAELIGFIREVTNANCKTNI